MFISLLEVFSRLVQVGCSHQTCQLFWSGRRERVEEKWFITQTNFLLTNRLFWFQSLIRWIWFNLLILNVSKPSQQPWGFVMAIVTSRGFRLNFNNTSCVLWMTINVIVILRSFFEGARSWPRLTGLHIPGNNNTPYIVVPNVLVLSCWRIRKLQAQILFA